MNTVLDIRSQAQNAPRSPLPPENKHLRRILVLSALFFVSGALFFFARIQSQHSAAAEPLPVQEAVAPVRDNAYVQLAGLPDPSTYDSFQYQSGMSTTTVQGTCTDTHIAILIFKGGDDYRADPRAAVFNSAFPCTKGSHYEIPINLAPIPLIVGTKYYIIHAPQDKGAWYNPY